MARKQNPDMKVVYIALAALGGLGAAYYFTRSKSGSTPSRLTDDAAAGNGGQLLLNNASTSSYVPQSYTPPPVAGSGVVNKAQGNKPATPKEKQQALNWLQALIQKNGTKSIYNPFSESDLATGSFGPKSRAALAIAEQVMRAAFAAFPPAANKNLFQNGVAGDAVLQALVDASILADATYTPNAAEIQALVKAAGGTVGASIGAATPSPSAAPSTSSSAPASGGITASACPAGRVKIIAKYCNYVNQILQYQTYLHTPAGISVASETTLTKNTVASYRKVLGMLAWCAANKSKTLESGSNVNGGAPMPTQSIASRITNPSTYTLFHKTDEGDIVRFDPTVLDYLNRWAISGKNFTGTSVGIDSNTTQADALEAAYDALSENRWSNNPAPNLLLSSDEARRLGVTNA
jgi:hypothetical protein